MGVELSLLISDGGDEVTDANTVIALGKTPTDLYELVETKLKTTPVTVPIYTLQGRNEEGETIWGPINDTPYGVRLTWTTPEQLLTLSDHPDIPTSVRKSAAWAYLRALPEDWPVFLYFH